MSKETIQPIVINCLGAILDQRGVPRPAEVTRDTLVFGANGLLDSIGIVTMVVDLEQAVHDTFGKAVSLADDRAMSQRSSPYRSVGALTDYIASQLEGVS